jgi:hypothetical protein
MPNFFYLRPKLGAGQVDSKFSKPEVTLGNRREVLSFKEVSYTMESPYIPSYQGYSVRNGMEYNVPKKKEYFPPTG